MKNGKYQLLEMFRSRYIVILQGGHSNFGKKLWSIPGVFKENNFNFKEYFPVLGKF